MKTLKKLLSIVLVVLVLLTSAPLSALTGIDLGFDDLFATESEAAAGLSGYYADAAAQWAKDHWNDYNSVLLGKGYWDDGGDCANFVSQCLYMGGMDMELLWHTSGYFAHWTESGYNKKFYGSWIRVDQLYNYLVERGATVITNPLAEQVSIGDVILYAKTTSSDKTHSAIVVDKVNGVPKIAYHSTGTKKECTTNWHLDFKGSLTFLIKLNGKTCKNGTVKNITVYKANGSPKLYSSASSSSSVLRTYLSGEYTHVYKTSGNYGYTFRYGNWGWINLSQFTKQGTYTSTSPNHTFGSWYTTKNASCTQEGTRERVCSKCGYKDKGTIAKIAHKLVAASCTKAQYCSVCNTSFGSKLGHNYSSWTIEYDSTCTASGKKIRRCTRCGITESNSINPKKHSMGQWYVVEASNCIKQGYEKRVCLRDNCTYYEVAILPLGDHSYGDEIIVREPNCTSVGEKKRICSVCGHEKFYNYGLPFGHDMGEWYISIPATDETPGVERSDCSRCDYYETRLIAEHDHEYGDWQVEVEPTCTVSGYKHRVCSVCLYDQVEITVATGHKVNTVEFGSYPQSRVYDENLLEELNALLDGEELISYEYYYGDNTPGSMQQGDYMKYADVELNGERYRYVDIVKARPLTTISSSDENDITVTLGNKMTLESVYSYQRYNKYMPNSIKAYMTGVSLSVYTNEENYWFKYEPIEWRVLDQDTGLVLCETIIDAQPYATIIYGELGENGEILGELYGDEKHSVYANDYEESNIREWLNSDFYDTAFSDEESGLILTTDIDGNKDKIFIMSADELTNNSYYFDINEDNTSSRVALSSDYAQCQGVVANTKADDFKVSISGMTAMTNSYIEFDDEMLNRWWTRTVVTDSSDAVRVVDANGNISEIAEYTAEFAADQGVGVRPAMRLDCIEILRDDMAPTCIKAGYIGDEYCYVCGETISTGYALEALGHNFVECTNIAPTCTENGLIEEACTRCGITQVVDEPEKLGHDMGGWYTVNDASCVQEGLERRDCLRENCGYYEDNILEKLEHIPVPGTGYEPTCEEPGLTDGLFCDYCGVTLDEQEEIDPLGHTGVDGNGEEVWIHVSDPDCSTPGRDELRCIREYDGEKCDHLINTRDIVVLEPTYYESFRKDSKCYEPGYVEFTCSHCNGEVEGHKYTKILDPVDHRYGEWETIIEPLCIYDGLERIDCMDCDHYDERSIPAEYDEHDLENITMNSTCVTGGHEYLECTRCKYTEGYEDIEPTGHNPVRSEEYSYAATCTEDGLDFYICTNNGCDYTSKIIIPALGHGTVYVSSTAPTCTESGYDTYKCTRENCDYISDVITLDALGHDDGKWVVLDKADCENEGEKELHCTRINNGEICDVRIETVHIFKREHNWSDWDITEAKCEGEGLETRECINTDTEEYEKCDATEENILPAIGHLWDNGVIDPESTCKLHGTKTYTCQNDNSHKKTESIALNPNNHVGETYIKGAKTENCTEDGYTGDIYCADCNRVIAYGEDIEAHGHKNTLENNDILIFGSYPQSIVTDDEILAKLNTMELEWKSYDYYTGTGEYGSMIQSDYMKYSDVEFNGSKYRAVVFTEYRPMHTHIESSAANSYQDDNGYATNCVYWFKYEPIQWRVLDAEKGIILSESIIDSQAYNDALYYFNKQYYGDDAYSAFACDFESSTIREWLNDEFYNIAFKEKEKELILTEKLDNSSCYTDRSEFDGSSTNDKVYLLSWNDVINVDYNFSSDPDEYDVNRRAQGTDYAKIQGVWVSVNPKYYGNSHWRLRSPGGGSNSTCEVYGNGYAHANYEPNDVANGIRPAVTLNMSSFRKEYDVAAECEKDGYYGRKYCAVCNEVLTERIVIPATGHDWDDGVINPESTCKLHGTKTYTCQNDISHKKTESVELNPDNHMGETYIKDDKATTCTEDGYTGDKHCSDCDALLEKGKVIDKLGHDMGKWNNNNNATHTRECQRDNGCTHSETEKCTFGEWFVTKDATCTSKGSKERTCTVCGYKETAVIELKAHTPGEAVIENEVAPKCEEKGSYDEVVYCTECPEELSREKKEIPATGHDWDNGVIDPESTCKLHGTKTYTCQNDNSHKKTESVDLNPDNHVGETYIKDDKAATCTEDGYTGDKHCSDCDALLEKGKVIDKLGHDMGKWNNNNNATHTRECQRDNGCTHSETEKCTFGEWFVTKDATCTSKGSKERTCTVCGYKETAVIELKAHAPGEAVIENEVAPKCEEKGSYDEVVYCTECPEELSREKKEIPATGHDWGEWHIVEGKEPTIYNDGEEIRVCKNNPSHKETNAIDKLDSNTAYFIVADENGDFEYNGKKYVLVGEPIKFAKGDIILAPKVPARDGFIEYWESYDTNVEEDIYVEAIYELKDLKNESNLETKKDISEVVNGVVTITLSAFAETLNAKVTKGATPYDIVLVLDQSSSMTREFGSNNTARDETKSRIYALKEVATTFIQTVYDSSVEYDVDHRIAIVGFSGTEDSYKNTGLLTPTGTVKTFGTLTNQDYASAFVDVRTKKSVLDSAIKNMSTKTGTAADYGMQMARQVLALNQNDDRQKLVLFITDGQPADVQGRGYNEFSTPIANDAIFYANQIKNNYGATIYSIGVAAGADPEDETKNINKYLHYISSNYPDAQSMTRKGNASANKNYFFTAEEKDAVKTVFNSIVAQKITNTISFTRVDFYDTISEYFTLTIENENALRKAVKAEYGVSDKDIIITRNADGTTTVRINNLVPKAVFDDSNIQIGYGATVKFDVTANEKTLDGGTFETNTEDAGVEHDGKTVMDFEVPAGKPISSSRAIVEFRIDGEVYAIREVSVGDTIIAPEVDSVDWVYTNGTTVIDKYTIIDSEYSSEKRNITWNIGDKQIIQEYNIGEKIIAPVVETPENMIFVGWNYSVPYRMPEYNLVFTAVFDEHKHKHSLTNSTGDCLSGIIYTYTCNCGDSYFETETHDAHNYSANVHMVECESVATMTCNVCGKSEEKIIKYNGTYNRKTSSSGRTQSTVVDLTLYNSSDIAVQPDGYIYVKLYVLTEILESARSGKLVIARVNESGKNDNLPKLSKSTDKKEGYYVDDIYLVLKLSHFSYYAIMLPEDEANIPSFEVVDCGFATGHAYKSIVTDPTCTVDGYTTYACSNCGDSYIDDIKLSDGHNYASVVTKPTCKDKGYTTYTCSVCKHSYKGAYKNALGHSMGAYSVTKYPSCTDSGTETAQCTRCSYTESRSVAASSHDYQNGVCTKCGSDKTKDCSCNCHKGGIAGFFFKIILFFQKIFKTNKVCKCGKAHY